MLPSATPQPQAKGYVALSCVAFEIAGLEKAGKKYFDRGNTRPGVRTLLSSPGPFLPEQTKSALVVRGGN